MEPKYEWVSEISSELDEMAEHLQETVEEDIVEEIEYGLNGILESSETYDEAEGLLTDARSFEEIARHLYKLSLGTIKLNGPSEYPTTTYELDLIAEGDEKYWEISSVDADTELQEHNNYVRNIEDRIEDTKKEETGIRRITESYQSESEYLAAVANS